jgi:uncharacterized membrane protein
VYAGRGRRLTRVPEGARVPDPGRKRRTQSATARALRRSRPSLARHRLTAFGGAAVLFAAIAVFAPAWLTGVTRLVTAYDAALIVIILMSWLAGMRPDPADTECRAALEDPGRNVVLLVVIGAVITGLVAAIVIIGGSHHVTNRAEVTIVYGAGVAAILLGWFLIHTMFVFRYAHLYYFDSDDDGSAQRGLTFPGTTEPNDYDFAYFSFVIGMTFQVSDVQITDPGVRRVVLLHALVSFAYNTTIFALVINLASGLIHA